MRTHNYLGTISAGSGWLYKDGCTAYQILIPENATEAECFAAEEMTRIFEGAGINIDTVRDGGVIVDPTAKYIALGKTVYFNALDMEMTAKEFKFDGFIIESLGNTYVIKGIGDTGTCFGVYGYAEYAMGYRYYFIDEWKVDKEASNKEFHIKEIPSFFSREALSYYTTIYDTHSFDDHSFRLRINGQFINREKKHGEGSPWSTLHDQSLALQLIDYTVYRKEHPDWFYLNPESEGAPPPKSNPQLCFSKAMLPDAEGGFFDTFMDHLLNQYIIPEQDKCYFMLGVSDNYDFCTCPECSRMAAKYKASGLNMQFVNKVADAVEAWRLENAPKREIWVDTFAYYATLEPPVVWENGTARPIDPSVVARDNVIVRLAPIGADYCYDLMDEEHNKQSREALLGWAAVAKNLSIWDYRSDFGTQTFPYPTTVTAQANHDIYCRLGMVDILNQGQPFTGGTPFQKMDDFARARMHWNAKERYDDLTAEFRKAYYKGVEPYVTEYLRKIERSYPIWRERGWTGTIGMRASLHKAYYTVEEMYEHKAILDKALAAAKAIEDEKIAAILYDRVNELTLFYKFVLVLCFPLEIPREEALDLIADLRVLSRKAELKTFLRKEDSTDAYLDDAENIVTGRIAESERRFKLKD